MSSFQERRLSLGGATRMGAPDWSKFVSSTQVTDADAAALRMYDDADADAVGQLIQKGSNGRELGAAALRVLASVGDAAALKYTCDLVQDALLPDVAARGALLFSAPEVEEDVLTGEQPPAAPGPGPAGLPSSMSLSMSMAGGLKLQLAPFVHASNHDDAVVEAKALYLASLLLSVSGDHPEQEVEMKTVLGKVCKMLDRHSGAALSSTQTALQALSVLLRSAHIRQAFDDRAGVSLLLDVLDTSSPSSVFASLGSDPQYHAMLCTWLACFYGPAAGRVGQPGLATLVRILRSEARSRVLRLCVSTIRIVLSDVRSQGALCEAAIEAKLPKTLAQVAERQSGNDKELESDMDWLNETLSRNFKVLTTFERHEQDLLSLKLSWSMIHDELFWRENALKFDHNNFSSVKKLIELLGSDNEETVAVACSDIGFFVQYFPNGKVIVSQNGGKSAVMKLLSHPSVKVQKQALSACSKIMVTNWESFSAAK